MYSFSNMMRAVAATIITAATFVGVAPNADAQTPLGVGGGGTGRTTFPLAEIVFGNGSNALGTDSNLKWDNGNKWLGIGIQPQSTFHLGSNVPHYPQILLESAHTTAGGPNYLVFRRSRGELGATTKQAIVSGDAIGSIVWQGYTSSGWVSSAAILGRAEGAPGANVPTGLSFTLSDGVNLHERMSISSSGVVAVANAVTVGATVNVGTNMTVGGNVTVAGNISAKYQDVAEWVPGTGELSDGSVVVLDPRHSNSVMPSEKAYDTSVAGVVSAQPGLLLGEPGEQKVKVATTGRVKVRVDATKGSIRIGDLLVTSAKSGTAMKSQTLDLGGTSIHRPGTVLGKALEPLNDGVSDILVLLTLQ